MPLGILGDYLGLFRCQVIVVHEPIVRRAKSRQVIKNYGTRRRPRRNPYSQLQNVLTKPAEMVLYVYTSHEGRSE